MHNIFTRLSALSNKQKLGISVGGVVVILLIILLSGLSDKITAGLQNIRPLSPTPQSHVPKPTTLSAAFTYPASLKMVFSSDGQPVVLAYPEKRSLAITVRPLTTMEFALLKPVLVTRAPHQGEQMVLPLETQPTLTVGSYVELRREPYFRRVEGYVVKGVQQGYVLINVVTSQPDESLPTSLAEDLLVIMHSIQ